MRGSRWGLNEMLSGIRELMFGYATPGLSYDDIFEFRVAWWLRFYRWTVFRCFVAPRPVPGEEGGARWRSATVVRENLGKKPPRAPGSFQTVPISCSPT